jgi:competence protein ComEC
VYKGDVTKGTHTYNATGLANNTAYTIGTRTVDTSGNVNQTWVNHTARTGSSGIRNLVVSFINVGYGDSILIESPSGKTMLIDAGDNSKGDNVAAYIQGRGISALDIAMVTHPHVDHFGGMPYVLKHIDVHQYIDNGQTGNGYASAVLDIVETQGIPYRKVRSGDIINLDPLLSVQVLNPQSTLLGDLNEDSLALKLVYNQDSFLLMADATSRAENKMISSQKDLNADVLKVGHHGDNGGTSSTFLSRVTPERSIISVGTNDSGYPSSSLISRLSSIGSSVYRTDKVGNVVITSNGLQYTVKTG